jgi:hypothetical protein
MARNAKTKIVIECSIEHFRLGFRNPINTRLEYQPKGSPTEIKRQHKLAMESIVKSIQIFMPEINMGMVDELLKEQKALTASEMVSVRYDFEKVSKKLQSKYSQWTINVTMNWEY